MRCEFHAPGIQEKNDANVASASEVVDVVLTSCTMASVRRARRTLGRVAGDWKSRHVEVRRGVNRLPCKAGEATKAGPILAVVGGLVVQQDFRPE